MDFKVPMREVQVELALAGATPGQFVLFLSLFSDRQAGAESLEEYLNGRRGFFPMATEGLSQIVNREQIVWIHVRDIENVTEEPGSVLRAARLQLHDGTELNGEIHINRPMEQSRISDVLNDPRDTFLRLGWDGSSHYVNKRYIRVVTPT